MRKRSARRIGAACAAALLATSLAFADVWQTPEEPQLVGLKNFVEEPIFTVGESFGGYTPTGIFDGIAAFPGEDGVQVLVNSELGQDVGAPYDISNGMGGTFSVTGARIHAFVIDPASRAVCGAGLAFDHVYGRDGTLAMSANDLNESGSATDGFSRFCSSKGILKGTYGFEDDVYLAPEETSAAYGHPHGGSYWALDVAARTLWACPDLGRGTWEGATPLDLGGRNKDYVALVLGDDYQGAPLYLYLGKKDAGGDFLARNGLRGGQLFVWRAKDGVRNPEEWNGTCTERKGTFVPIDAKDAAKAGLPGYDAAGYKDDLLLRDEATGDAGPGGLEAFAFSRPEDLATNPRDGKEIVFASTGRGSLFPSDDWGTTYVARFKVKKIDKKDLAGSKIEATLTILFDGDDAGGGTFASPDHGLRSPDNLEWATDGYIYVQEDRSVGGFGLTSGEEASIWQLDPKVCGWACRVAQINRGAALPGGQTDPSPGDIGNWESSGIVDVTAFFDTAKGETLFLADVQAHSVRDGNVADQDLVQGGQLLLLSVQADDAKGKKHKAPKKKKKKKGGKK